MLSGSEYEDAYVAGGDSSEEEEAEEADMELGNVVSHEGSSSGDEEVSVARADWGSRMRLPRAEPRAAAGAPPQPPPAAHAWTLHASLFPKYSINLRLITG